jgi:hypothetical protein
MPCCKLARAVNGGRFTQIGGGNASLASVGADSRLRNRRLGAPLDGAGDVTGFSILEGESRSSIEELLADHPHRNMPGAEIDALEFMAVPGMEG